jgi:hypothetical protein
MRTNLMLGPLDASVSGISAATTPVHTQHGYDLLSRQNPSGPINPLKSRLGPIASFHDGSAARDLTPTRDPALQANNLMVRYATGPADQSKWASEGSETGYFKPPLPGKPRSSAQETQDLASSQELAFLRARVQQLESENKDLQMRLKESSNNEQQLASVGDQIRKLYRCLKDHNASWAINGGAEGIDDRVGFGLDTQKVSIVVDKAIQSIQNGEVTLVKQVNEVHRKYGLSHYCISRLRDLNKQLKHSLERIQNESPKVPIQVQTGNWVYVHKDPDTVVSSIEDCIRAWLKKINNLEESPEFNDLRADLQ